MNYTEQLCYASLKMILREDIGIETNIRPDWLKNPFTGRNLEVDLYLPYSGVGFEIQGKHHFEDSYQKEKDEIKKELFKKKNRYLFELGIFQITPSYMHLKLRQHSKINNIDVGLKRNNTDFWRSDLYKSHIEKINNYKNLIKNKYKDKEPCHTAPYLYFEKEVRDRLKDQITYHKYALVEHQEDQIRIEIKEVTKSKVLGRICGSSKERYFKLNRICKLV